MAVEPQLTVEATNAVEVEAKAEKEAPGEVEEEEEAPAKSPILCVVGRVTLRVGAKKGKGQPSTRKNSR